MSSAVFFEFEKDAFKNCSVKTIKKHTSKPALHPGSGRVRWMCTALLLACGLTATRVVLQMLAPPPRTSWISLQQRVKDDLKKQMEEPATACDIPAIDPFLPEIRRLQKFGALTNITCPGKDWVQCHHNICRVEEEILKSMRSVICTYKDILHESDSKYSYGPPVTVYGGDPYYLVESDQVLVECGGKKNNEFFFSMWSRPKMGFRYIPKPPANNLSKYNVLFIGFDSVSHNRFIRELPRSYRKLYEMDAVILKGYNIVGDGTSANLIPILTGRSPVDLPDARHTYTKEGTLDSWPFVFHDLEKNGYRTFYTEDTPDFGTFQYKYSGFKKRPAEHYWYSFYKEEAKKFRWYCIGDKPTYLHLFDIAKQFLDLDGYKYGMAFSGDLSLDRPSQLFVADEDLVKLLNHFKDGGHLENTMLVVFGDHGPRYDDVRNTLQGRIEERMPMMAILLPERLKKQSPQALVNLRANAAVLTIPHDIHATAAQVTGLGRRGSDYAYSLLNPIPFNRNCVDARIESYWCICLKWNNVSQSDELYNQTATALMEHINGLTEPYRNLCALRQLSSISWVMRNIPNGDFKKSTTAGEFASMFSSHSMDNIEKLTVRITTEPGNGIYEGSVAFVKSENTFIINTNEISRTTRYNDEPNCIWDEHPELNLFCYCYQRKTKKVTTSNLPRSML